MKPGEQVEIQIDPWLAKERGIGTIFSAQILEVREKSIKVSGHTVLRQPPSGKDGIPCRLCSRPLTEPASISVGYGPDCAVHLGLTNKFIRDLRRGLTRDEKDAAERSISLKSLWLPLSKIKIVPIGTEVLDTAQANKAVPPERAKLLESAAVVAANMRHEEISTDPLPVSLPFDCVPRSYQWAGARFMVDRKKVGNWDKMGTGKTIQGILYMMEATRRLSQVGRYGPCVVICPPVMSLTWKRELEKWWQGCRVQVLKGYTAKVNKKIDVYVMPWSILSSGYMPKLDEKGRPVHREVLRPDGTTRLQVITDPHRVKLSETCNRILEEQALVIVGDEAHNAKNPQAQRSMALKLFALPAEYIALMTGTAVLNRPAELITQLDLIDILETEFETKDKFEIEFAGKKLTWTPIKGGGRRKTWQYTPVAGSKLVELHRRLVPYIIRRRTEDVLKDMPPLNLARIIVDLANRDEYDALEEEIAELPPSQRLGKMAQLRQLCGIGKIPSMVEWISEFLECEEKLVVFASHRLVQRTLIESFEKWKPATILGQSEGGTGPKNQAAVDRFQTDPNCLLAICSTGAAREGITLTAASNLLMTELEWTPGVLDQASARVHRMGQTADRVTIWTLAADESMDDTLLEKLLTKRLITGEILDGEGDIPDEDVIRNAVVRDLVIRVARRKKKKKVA